MSLGMSISRLFLLVLRYRDGTLEPTLLVLKPRLIILENRVCHAVFGDVFVSFD